MQSIIDLIARPETLNVTNAILTVCIIFHLICEFTHYIHEFLSHRKERNQVKENVILLKKMMGRIKEIEKTQCENCSHINGKEEHHEKMDASGSSPL